LDTALTAGAVDYILKPIVEVELLAWVANMLRISDAYLIIKQHKALLQSQLLFKLINIQQLIELKQATIKQLANIKNQTLSLL